MIHHTYGCTLSRPMIVTDNTINKDIRNYKLITVPVICVALPAGREKRAQNKKNLVKIV